MPRRFRLSLKSFFVLPGLRRRYSSTGSVTGAIIIFAVALDRLRHRVAS